MHACLLSCQGSNFRETFEFARNKHVKRVYSRDAKGFVFCCDHDLKSKITLPEDKTQQFDSRARFLVLQIFFFEGKRIAVELIVRDVQRTKRRLIFTSAVKDITTNPLHARIPTTTFIRGKWINLVFDLHSLMNVCFKQAFLALEKFTIGSCCKVKRVFTLETPPPSTGMFDVSAPIPSSLDFPPGVISINQIVNGSSFTNQKRRPPANDFVNSRKPKVPAVRQCLWDRIKLRDHKLSEIDNQNSQQKYVSGKPKVTIAFGRRIESPISTIIKKSEKKVTTSDKAPRIYQKLKTSIVQIVEDSSRNQPPQLAHVNFDGNLTKKKDRYGRIIVDSKPINNGSRDLISLVSQASVSSSENQQEITPIECVSISPTNKVYGEQDAISHTKLDISCLNEQEAFASIHASASTDNHEVSTGTQTCDIFLEKPNQSLPEKARESSTASAPISQSQHPENRRDLENTTNDHNSLCSSGSELCEQIYVNNLTPRTDIAVSIPESPEAFDDDPVHSRSRIDENENYQICEHSENSFDIAAQTDSDKELSEPENYQYSDGCESESYLSDQELLDDALAAYANKTESWINPEVSTTKPSIGDLNQRQTQGDSYQEKHKSEKDQHHYDLERNENVNCNILEIGKHNIIQNPIQNDAKPHYSLTLKTQTPIVNDNSTNKLLYDPILKCYLDLSSNKYISLM
eukprot:982767_1